MRQMWRHAKSGKHYLVQISDYLVRISDHESVVVSAVGPLKQDVYEHAMKYQQNGTLPETFDWPETRDLAKVIEDTQDEYVVDEG